ncbi:MAG: YibE/F family protein [Candidatus Syntrophonatronum acetioxidans]|uniref:YibE/F family protein n=1 Tax=Candidatus Syntrophonatronum acetioxidans TaxID=1795816 RepID=A0A424Y916_9FIRM|nr:MAG: YibE/F family protein [Candidatus Syntrophonatronum acetioxidans]
MDGERVNKKRIIMFFLLAVFIMVSLPPGVSGYQEREEIVLRGRVIEAQEFQPEEDYVLMEQVARVEVTSGELKGEVFTVDNYIMDHPGYDMYLEEGREVLLLAEKEDGLVREVFLKDMVRDKYLYYLTGFFALLLILVGGKKGIKTIAALLFTALVIVRIMLPLILEGYNPILVSVSLASLTAVFTLVVIGGLEKKTLAAVIGTITGVVVAGLLALWVGNLAHLTGFSSEEAQMLMYMEGAFIDVRGLLFAGIIIGSLGAVTDVGISIASAVSELKKNNPRAGSYSLMVSGINIGRDIMGTMANTLILAYVGGATPLLLLLLGYEMAWIDIINLDLVATEVLRSVAGSIGLVITIPVTALASTFLLKKSTWPKKNY